MTTLPTNFTFGDNSTLTSFTDVRQHPKYPPGDDGVSTGSVAGTYLPNADDCRSEEEDKEDKENSHRESSIHRKKSGSSKIKADWTRSSRSNGSHETSKFWATLSVHAASAAMSSSWNKKMKENAASAAAQSLLEDGETMERINAARREHQLQQEEKHKQRSHLVVTDRGRPPMKITHQTVRNAASKASIAVLQSGANQELATLVASAVLKEGSRLVWKQQRRKNEASASASRLTSTPSKESLSSKGSSSTVATRNTAVENLNGSYISSSHSTKSRNSIAVQSLQGKVLQGNKDSQRDDATVLSIRSISTAKFGKDKYSMTVPITQTETTMDSTRMNAGQGNSDCRPFAKNQGSQATHEIDYPVNILPYLQSETKDDSTISTKTHHKLDTYHGEKSEQEHPDRACTASDIQKVPGEAFDFENVTTVDKPRSDEEELDRKHANFLAAMETLQQKLNELDSQQKLSASHSSSHSSSVVIGNRQVQLRGSGSKEMEANIQLGQQQLTEVIQKQLQQLPQEQLQQLSMIVNPTMLTDKNSSSCTHYPPLPAMDSMTVDSKHHGYGLAAPSESISIGQGSASSCSSAHGRYSIPASWTSSDAAFASQQIDPANDGAGQNPSSTTSLARSGVLKKPSTCFPIFEGEDGSELYKYSEEDAWNEDGTEYFSVGECRIHTMTSRGNESQSECADIEITASTNNVVDGEEKSAEEAVEVMLMSDQKNAGRLKDRVKSFFSRKSKKVTFDLDNSDGSPTENDANLILAMGQPDSNDQGTLTRGRSQSHTRTRRRRFREKFMKKLNKALAIAKSQKHNSSRSSQKSQKNASNFLGAVAGAEHCEDVVIDLCCPAMDNENEAIIDNDHRQLPPAQNLQMTSDNAGVRRTESTDIVRNNTAQSATSRSTITSNGSYPRHGTFENSFASSSLIDSDQYNTASSGSNSGTSTSDREVRTFDSSRVTLVSEDEESWVETVLSRFTGGFLINGRPVSRNDSSNDSSTKDGFAFM